MGGAPEEELPTVTKNKNMNYNIIYAVSWALTSVILLLSDRIGLCIWFVACSIAHAIMAHSDIALSKQGKR